MNDFSSPMPIPPESLPSPLHVHNDARRASLTINGLGTVYVQLEPVYTQLERVDAPVSYGAVGYFFKLMWNGQSHRVYRRAEVEPESWHVCSDLLVFLHHVAIGRSHFTASGFDPAQPRQSLATKVAILEAFQLCAQVFGPSAPAFYQVIPTLYQDVAWSTPIFIDADIRAIMPDEVRQLQVAQHGGYSAYCVLDAQDGTAPEHIQIEFSDEQLRGVSSALSLAAVARLIQAQPQQLAPPALPPPQISASTTPSPQPPQFMLPMSPW